MFLRRFLLMLWKSYWIESEKTKKLRPNSIVFKEVISLFTNYIFDVNLSLNLLISLFLFLVIEELS
jgi:hypothetical protein